MIKLWLKHIILDTALNNLFAGLEKAFAIPVVDTLQVGKRYSIITVEVNSGFRNKISKYYNCNVTHLTTEGYVMFTYSHCIHTKRCRDENGIWELAGQWGTNGGHPIIKLNTVIQIKE